jgi:hypothetical protein
MNEEEQRKNDGAAGFYTVILPMDLSTEIRIIFSWAVALISISNFRRYFFNLALKF